MSDVETTHFLNVDLDLSGPSGLARLVQALEPALMSLRVSEQEATLELAKQPRGVGEAMDQIATAVERLGADLRATWDSCQSRTMNVGVAAGRAPHETAFAVRLSTLSRLTAIGADLVFTVYGSKQPSAPPSPTTRKTRAETGGRRAKRIRRRSNR